MIKVNETGDEINKDSTQATNQYDWIKEKREYFLITYILILVFGTLFYAGRSFSFFKMCLRISINMHDMLFRGITRAKMIFFNRNPSGRILNRFSLDIGNVDSLLPVILFDIFDVSSNNTKYVHLS